MTVAGSAAALTKAINDTTKALDITEASLDAKVTSVQASEAAAGADKAEAEGYRDTTAAHAASVASDLTTVQDNVTYQGISAILAEKAVTAVDVFVYDTSLDSDGGAWRKRCQHTSWYNEELNTATRGARREFPAVAVIIADLNDLTIYDGDDPALPMWMVFERTTIACWLDGAQTLSCVTAKNGIVALGSSYDEANRGGLRVFNFVADFGEHFVALSQFYTGKYAGGIAQRQTTGRSYSGNGKLISDDVVNAVAMAVLPDAPVDPATGLPVPTIAVGCGVTGQPNGGTSIIKHDGRVIDIVASTGAGGYACFDLGFGRNGQLVTTQSYNRSYGYVHIFDELPTDDILASTTPAGARTYSYGVGYPSVRGTLLGAPSIHDMKIKGEVVSFALGNRLSHLLDDGTAKAQSMVAYAASKYTSGWLVGDIRGAFLADTNDTDLGGGGELVTNGTFDTDLSSWTNLVNATWENGQIRCANGAFQQNAVFTGSKTVRISWDQTANAGTRSRLRLRNAAGSADVGPFNYYSGSGQKSITLSTESGLSVWFYIEAADDFSFDNISIKELETDRSVNANGLIVNGTITRAPVADGAELVGYSGFSATNYLEQPYNSALDFGTGDFCVMGWITRSAASDWLVDRLSTEFDGSGDKSGFWVWQNGDQIRFDTFEDGASTTVLSTTSMVNGPWYMFAALREEGVLKLYVNGVLDASNSIGFVRNVDPGAWIPPVLAIGARRSNHAVNSAPWLNGKAALIRISATAPTADQIRRIYEDERKLFMPGAQCALYGTSDAVTALAHDPKTKLLHVGTSQGRTVFDGLQRVANTETPVTTAISAACGLIVEE